MKNRIWRPQPQLTATVRLTALASNSLAAWLSTQTFQPRTANEALNMALEGLAASRLCDVRGALQATYSRLVSELEELNDRMMVTRTELEIFEEKARQSSNAETSKEMILDRALSFMNDDNQA